MVDFNEYKSKVLAILLWPGKQVNNFAYGSFENALKTDKEMAKYCDKCAHIHYEHVTKGNEIAWAIILWMVVFLIINVIL